MTTLSLFSGSVSDGTTALTLAVRRNLDSDLPIALIIDGDELGLPLDQAAKLALAGDRVERTLFKAREAPKESTTVFQRTIGFPDGTVSTFELGIVADPPGVSLVWNTKRLALGLGAIGELLFALSRVRNAVDDARGVSRPAFDDARGLLQRPFPPQPAPGQRWETWQPQFWRPDGPLGNW
jgi:hypothetical protein